MRLTFNTAELAQEAADAIHANMIAASEAYAQSVKEGQTLRWAEPYQDLNEKGNPVDALWHVTVKERCKDCLPDGKTMKDATERPASPARIDVAAAAK